MNFHAFTDPEGFGLMLYVGAKRRGWNSKLFSSIHDLDGQEGLCFVNMKHRDHRREEDKKMMRRLIDRDFPTIPDARSAKLYDDKIAQAKLLKRWLPRTFILKSEADALKALEKLKFPFISKAAVGSGSHNVRLIEGEKRAAKEIALVFGKGKGIALREGVQRGYLLWQEFLAGNAYDYRVLIIGRTARLVLRRHNRPDRPMASGSGRTEPITEMTDEVAEVLAFANKIAEAEKILWAGFDIVRCAEKGWRLLETTVSWTIQAGYLDCRFIGENGSGRMGFEMFEELLDAVERGDFQRDEA